jgi:hypothetical protein
VFYKVFNFVFSKWYAPHIFAAIFFTVIMVIHFTMHTVLFHTVPK